MLAVTTMEPADAGWMRVHQRAAEGGQLWAQPGHLVAANEGCCPTTPDTAWRKQQPERLPPIGERLGHQLTSSLSLDERP